LGDYVEMAGIESMYRSQLLRLAPGGLSGMMADINCRNIQIRNMMRQTLIKLGCDISQGAIMIEMGSQGDKARIFCHDAGPFRHHDILAAVALGEMERGRDIALPFDAPRMLDYRAEPLGRKVLRYLDTPADNSDQQARKLAKLQLWSRDALMQMIMLLHLAKRAGGLQNLRGKLGDFDTQSRTIETTGNPAALLRELGGQRPGDIGEGVVLDSTKGVVLVRPLKRGHGIKILAESVNAEIASELCDSAEELLRRAGAVPPS
jgi:mannose-1-phosphate guanylyltransferase/phosphomannomutase